MHAPFEREGDLLRTLISFFKGFFLFWYAFLIGDDWIGAAIIMGGFAGTFGLLEVDAPAFWLLPLAVVLSVTSSLFRTFRSRSGPSSGVDRKK